jgi:hypothetical protein
MPRIRVDRAFLVIMVVVLLAPGASSQTLDVLTQVVIEKARTAKTEADLRVVAEEFRSLVDPLALWYAAVYKARTAHGPLARVDQINLLRLALILDPGGLTEIPSSDEQSAALDLLQPIELKALQTETDFPLADDLLLYLLARQPSLKDHFSTDEVYRVTRFTPCNSNRTIKEWTSKPYMDLTSVSSAREIAPDKDSVELSSGELAQTRTFFLTALPDIVVAAKAVRIASLAPVPRRAYAYAVAYYALKHARGWENENIALTVWNILHKAIEYAEQSSSDPVLTRLAEALRRDKPGAAFFARCFVTAATDYQKAGNNPDAEPKVRLWAAWGEAISRFAAGEVAAARDGFGRMAALLGQGDKKYAYLLGAFLDVLPEAERETLRDTAQWRVAASEQFAAVPDPHQMVRIDDSFSQTMWTMGRTDLGLAHMLRRLEAVQALPRKDRDQLKPIYLHQVRILAEALFADISFMLTTEKTSSRWEQRPVAGYPARLDFLHHLRSDCQPASAGEVVVLSERDPYGMQNPEEDRATILNAYGQIVRDPYGMQTLEEDRATILNAYGQIEQTPSSSDLLSDLVRDWLLNHPIYGNAARQSLTSPTAPNSRTETTQGIARWVMDARDRTEPSPSIVPYLKLVWVEWFALAFPSWSRAPAGWLANSRYLPSEASGLTRPEQVVALKNHPAATSQQKVLIDRFLALRALFESEFP